MSSTLEKVVQLGETLNNSSLANNGGNAETVLESGGITMAGASAAAGKILGKTRKASKVYPEGMGNNNRPSQNEKNHVV